MFFKLAYIQEKAKELKSFNYTTFKDENLKRQFEKLTNLGHAALSDTKFRQLIDAVTAMQSNYAKLRVCSYSNRTNCNYQLEPELTQIFKKSKDPEELQYYWLEFYSKAGAPVRKHFETYVELNNEAARLNSKKLYF